MNGCQCDHLLIPQMDSPKELKMVLLVCHLHIMPPMYEYKETSLHHGSLTQMYHHNENSHQSVTMNLTRNTA